MAKSHICNSSFHSNDTTNFASTTSSNEALTSSLHSGHLSPICATQVLNIARKSSFSPKYSKPTAMPPPPPPRRSPKPRKCSHAPRRPTFNHLPSPAKSEIVGSPKPRGTPGRSILGGDPEESGKSRAHPPPPKGRQNQQQSRIDKSILFNILNDKMNISAATAATAPG